MKIRKGREKDYQTCLEKNHDSYGKAIIRYAEEWAGMMEQEIEKSGNAETVIKEKAEELSYAADTKGITGFMYCCAVSLLSLCWEYGEPLRRWYNGKYGHSGKEL